MKKIGKLLNENTGYLTFCLLGCLLLRSGIEHFSTKQYEFVGWWLSLITYVIICWYADQKMMKNIFDEYEKVKIQDPFKYPETYNIHSLNNPNDKLTSQHNIFQYLQLQYEQEVVLPNNDRLVRIIAVHTISILFWVDCAKDAIRWVYPFLSNLIF